MIRIPLLLAVLLFTTLMAYSNIYYVAPNGNDTNAGTITAPFLTIQRAQTAVAAGDTVYVRGGTYMMQESQIATFSGTSTVFAFVTHLTKSGTAGKRINYWAYPGERPVFDYTNVKPANTRINAFEVTGSWIHLKGLEVVGVQMNTAQNINTQSICFSQTGAGGNNIYEQLSMHDGMAIGFYLTRGGNTLILNCDAYNNWDNVSSDKLGGNVDGFGAHPNSTAYTGIVFRGCRAWYNSDDGYDCIQSFAPITFENCWSFRNGYSTAGASLANGLGFKVGGFGVSTPPSGLTTVPRHTVRNCVAANNKSDGFYANHHLGGSDWYNNTAYRNSTNFDMLGRKPDFSGDTTGYGHVLRNNISLSPRASNGHIANYNPDLCTIDHNTFLNTSVSVTTSDFQSLDTSLIRQPRLRSGDLPVISLLRLAAGSDLIDAGINVGLPYAGSNPDLGYAETPAVPTGLPGQPASATWPLTASATVNATGSGAITPIAEVRGPAFTTAPTYNNRIIYGAGPVSTQNVVVNPGPTSTNSTTAHSNGGYVQFVVSPQTNNDFTINTVSFYMGNAGAASNGYSIEYSQNSDFSSAVVLGGNPGGSGAFPARDTLFPFSYSPSGLNVPSGKTLYLRIYAWNTNGTGTRSLLLNNLVISGKTLEKDIVAPEVSSIKREMYSIPQTNATSVGYRVIFTKNVSGVDASDFTLATTGNVTGTIATVTAISAAVYEIVVNNLTGEGDVRLDLKAVGTGITDETGNALTAGFTAGEIYTRFKLEQAITFAALQQKYVGDADFNAGASASSALEVSYTSSNENVATVVNGIVHITGAGATTITASQAGNNTYHAAADVSQALTVNKKEQVITFNALDAKTAGDADFDPAATASSSLPVTYSSSNLSVATIVDGKIHLVDAGTSTITATQDGDDTYAAAAPQTQTLTVNRLYYADEDKDGFGSVTVALLPYPVAPEGYATNNTDCNDGNASVHTPVQYYVDADGDGFGSNVTALFCSSLAPSGYVANHSDCDDTKILYADTDGDGLGAGAPIACGVANNTDCDDTNPVQLTAGIPDVYAMNPAVDKKNTIYIGYGPSSLTVKAIPAGGTAPYTYSWSNGGTAQAIAVSSAGTYTVNITDAKGCQTSSSITIGTLDVRCGNNNDKVMICHNNKMICVASASVQEHLGHGDNLGACPSATLSVQGIVPEEAAYQVTVYPNPVSDQLNIRVSKLQAGATVQVYNTAGVLVLTKRIINTTQTLSVKGWASGIYYVQINNGDQRTTEKIIK